MQVELIVELRQRQRSSYLAKRVERAYTRLPMVGEFVWLFEDPSPRNVSLPVGRVVWGNDGVAQLFFHLDRAALKDSRSPVSEQRLIEEGYTLANHPGLADPSNDGRIQR